MNTQRQATDGAAPGMSRNAPWDTAAAHRFLTSDGAALHVECSGPADADVTVVLAHGWTQDMRTWDVVLGLLGETVRVLRYDLRGHGGSAQAAREAATVARGADDLAELIEGRAPHGRVVLAGHSMGGMMIMALAQRHPELVARRIAAFALVATASEGMDVLTLGLPDTLATTASRGEKRLFRAAGHTKGRFPRWLRDHPGLLRPGARWLVFGRRPRRADVTLAAHQVLESHPASVAWYRFSIAEHDRTAALGALAGKPSVVMVGDRDRLCPPPRARVMADALPNAEFVRLPGAGHMLPYERPDEVATQITRLVAESKPVESVATDSPAESATMEHRNGSA